MDWRDVLIWIIFLLTLVVLTWYIFGNSPTLQEAIIVFVLGAIFE